MGPRIVTCRFENGNEPCRGTDHREQRNGSSPCTPLPAIAFQFHLAAAPHKQFATIGSRRSMHGKLRLAAREIFGGAGLCRHGKLNVTTPDYDSFA